MGISITRLTVGGSPLRTQELLVRFIKFKWCSTDQENYRGKPKVVDLRVTEDVTVQLKVKMFDDLAYLVLSRTTAVSDGN